MENNFTLISILRKIEDPRIERTRLHNLIDILVIAICSSMCGMTGWEEFEAFGEEKKEWFSSFLKLPNGIPSHDTFRRVFQRLDPKQLQNALIEWIQQLKISLEGKVVAIDGKTLRASFDNAKGLNPLHTVCAFATESNFILGQTFVKNKENEITAIPELLEMLEIKGAIVTIDAIGCQKAITNKICKENKAEYVLALKRNQPYLHDEVAALFRLAEKHPQITTDFFRSSDKGHGRIEERECTCIEAGPWLEHVAGKWTNLHTVAKIVAKIQRKGKFSEETRYFLSSLPCNAKNIAHAVREHWRIENTLHWSLDVVFAEDKIHISKDNSPKNLSIIRRIAFSLAKERTPKGLTTKRAQLKSVLSSKFANEYFFKD